MGHTKKIYKITKDKKNGFWHKLKEISIEIFIIVFAVTLSIWLHGRSEHTHQQKEVKDFLAGLKTDLESDMKEMQEDLHFFKEARKAFTYLTKSRFNGPLSIDSIMKYNTYLNNMTQFIVNNGRFEGFKSAGKLTNIENKELQDNILSFFQEDVPALLLNTNQFNQQKLRLFAAISEVKKTSSNGVSNLPEVLVSDPVQNILTSLLFSQQIEYIYEQSMVRGQKIISLINKELEK